MFSFFKNKNKTVDNNEDDLLSKIASLLIHAAKIDENYTAKEKEIINKTLLDLGAKKENMDELMLLAEKNESNSNQILHFTKEIKNLNDQNKEKIIEALWNVIYSDKDSDIYEENLMRRMSGLMYLDNKVVGNIKERIKSKK